MAKVKVHIYASAYDLQGESVEVDERDLDDPKKKEALTERLFDEFCHWLKHPKDPEDFDYFKRKMEMNGFDSGSAEIEPDTKRKEKEYREVSHRKTLEDAEARRSRGHAGIVGELHGYAVRVTKRMQVVIQNKKTGRFTSFQEFGES